MRRGVALTDEDRKPWLETLRDVLREHMVRGQTVVLACSALLPKYRDLLRTAAAVPMEFPNCEVARDWNSHVVFVYLKCSADVLAARVTAREKAGSHFMPASLLQSQIDALHIDSDEGDILATDATLSPPLIVDHIRKQLVV
jgi:gluconokinase